MRLKGLRISWEITTAFVLQVHIVVRGVWRHLEIRSLHCSHVSDYNIFNYKPQQSFLPLELQQTAVFRAQGRLGLSSIGNGRIFRINGGMARNLFSALMLSCAKLATGLPF